MFTIRKAERRQAKLRLALTGVSGSGKSLGAINLAAGMGKRFVVIDTEHRSADLYADVAKYDVLTLDKPFTPEKYIQAINHCETAGYEIIIVDSLSHAWAGEGGVLDMHDAATQASSSKNSWTAWKDVTPWQNKLVNTIIQSPAHIIITMRVKTHYDVIDVGGKKRPVKIGLSPIQKEGLEYEFTCVLSMDKDSYLYTSSKDRTNIFEGKHEKLSIETGKKIMEWLESGKSIEESQQEEISMLRDQMNTCETVEALRSIYSMAKNRYPAESASFLKLAEDRSKLLKATGEMVS
jgi:AAA domain